MRCYCCNNPLSYKQTNRKFAASGEFTEMCDKCLSTIDVETEEGASVDEDDKYFDEDGNPIED